MIDLKPKKEYNKNTMDSKKQKAIQELGTGKEEVLQAIIDYYGLSYDEINDLNHDYDFNYPDDEDDTCPDCGKHYDDCTCDDEDKDYIDVNTDEIAQDEFARHEFEQFKKKNNPGGGSTPQQGL